MGDYNARKPRHGDEDQSADRTQKVGIHVIRVPHETADLKMLTKVDRGTLLAPGAAKG
jgi:hypothetical protein